MLWICNIKISRLLLSRSRFRYHRKHRNFEISMAISGGYIIFSFWKWKLSNFQSTNMKYMDYIITSHNHVILCSKRVSSTILVPYIQGVLCNTYYINIHRIFIYLFIYSSKHVTWTYLPICTG
jgi:hypothetical protein